MINYSSGFFSVPARRDAKADFLDKDYNNPARIFWKSLYRLYYIIRFTNTLITFVQFKGKKGKLLFCSPALPLCAFLAIFSTLYSVTTIICKTRGAYLINMWTAQAAAVIYIYICTPSVNRIHGLKQ